MQALMDAKDELSPDHFIIITEDEEGLEIIGDTEVKILPLWKWLLSE